MLVSKNGRPKIVEKLVWFDLRIHHDTEKAFEMQCDQNA
jgi:hypothetical protein